MPSNNHADPLNGLFGKGQNISSATDITDLIRLVLWQVGFTEKAVTRYIG